MASERVGALVPPPRRHRAAAPAPGTERGRTRRGAPAREGRSPSKQTAAPASRRHSSPPDESTRTALAALEPTGMVLFTRLNLHEGEPPPAAARAPRHRRLSLGLAWLLGR